MSTAALIRDDSSPTTARRAADVRAVPDCRVARYSRAARSSSPTAAAAALHSSGNDTPRSSQPRARSSSRSLRVPGRPHRSSPPCRSASARRDTAPARRRCESRPPAGAGPPAASRCARRARSRTRPARRPADRCSSGAELPDLAGQLLRLERLEHHARRPGLRQPRLVEVAPGREQDDRHRARRRVRLQPAAHFVPVHLGHHDVHQDHVRRGAAGELDAGGSGAGRHHVPACGELERSLHEPEQVRVVIDDQRAEGVGHRSWLRAGMSPILAGARENIGRMNAKVYILDDDLVHAKLVAANLGPGRLRTQVFDRPDALLARHAEEPADAVITDLVMPDLDGVEVTRRLRSADRHLPIFVLTGHADVATAIEALKAGATEYLTKPVNIDELTTLLTRALAERPLLEEGASLEQARGREYSVQAILGQHPKIEEVRAFVRHMAAIPRPTVLLLGESGTGKNLVARAMHYSTPQAVGRFVEINCSALPANLLEAELFGYKKGAFTDAREPKRGLIEVADGGTLFLDEIADLDPELQAKLLNFLESRRFRRLGGTDEIEVALRLVTATNRDLEAQVNAGRFRADLYYRVTVAAVTLPPLREIKDDLPLLADHFRDMFNREFKKRVESIDTAVLAALRDWDWPGNVRELRNVIERAMIFTDGPTLKRSDLPALAEPGPATASPGTRVRSKTFHLPKGLSLAAAEREYIRLTLEETEGNIQKAAELLGISRKSLWERRKRYGLLPDAAEPKANP